MSLLFIMYWPHIVNVNNVMTSVLHVTRSFIAIKRSLQSS